MIISNLYFVYICVGGLALLSIVFFFFSSLRAVDVYARIDKSTIYFPKVAKLTRLGIREIFKYHLTFFYYRHCLLRVNGECLSRVKIHNNDLLVAKITQDTKETWSVSGTNLFFGEHLVEPSTFLVFNLLQSKEKNAKVNYKVRQYISHKQDSKTGDILIESVKYKNSGEKLPATHLSSKVLGIVTMNLTSGDNYHS